MFTPHQGDPYPLGGEHENHEAIVVLVDAHGIPSWVDAGPAPTLMVQCSCGKTVVVDLTEVVDISAAA